MDDDVDDPEAAVAEDLESTDHPDQPAWIDGSVAELSCECAESYPTAARDELEADIEGEVTDILELRFSVTVNYPAHGGAGLVSELGLYRQLVGRDKSPIRCHRS